MKHRLLTVVTFGLILLMIPFIVHAVDYTGSCGANLTWTLNNEGVMTISGTGAMYNYGQNPPYANPTWTNYQVNSVIINEGVTSIGDYAFDNLSSNTITNISFPTSITSIGMLAFPGFSNQCTINYSGTEEQWNALVNKNNTKAYNPGLFYSNVSIIYTCTEHTAGNPESENIVAATCISAGSYDEVIYCSVCGVQMDRTTHTVPALGHDYHWSVTTEPTCTQTGIETGTCSRCNETDTRTVAASRHLLKPHEVQAPTCTESGQNAYWDCTRCGKNFSDENGENEIAENSWVTNPLGHNMISHVAVAATCTTAGNSAYWDCDRCQKYFSDKDGKTETQKDSWVIDPLGHIEVVDAAVAATCTETGLTEGKHCSRCNSVLTAQTSVDALGHDFGNWIQTTAPTCEKDGEETRYCSRCDAAETQSVNALGHGLQHHNPQEPTCDDIGWDAYDTCSRCDYSTYVEKNALGHSYGE